MAEIGYWVRAEARGRGVATRAVRLAAGWAFDQGDVVRLQLRADVHNRASQRVAENAGFQREGVLRSVRYSRRQKRRVDFVMYSRLAGEDGLAANSEREYRRRHRAVSWPPPRSRMQRDGRTGPTSVRSPPGSTGTTSGWTTSMPAS